MGKASTVVTLPDGRQVTVKDPDEPAVMDDADILYALRNSRAARWDYNLLYPTLDANSQARLDALIAQNPLMSSLLNDPQTTSDDIQHESTTAGIRMRPRLRPAIIWEE